MKFIATSLYGALAASTLLAGAAQAATTLNYGSYTTARHPIHVDSVQPYFKTVTEATNGELKFILHSDGTIASGRNTLQAVRDGLLEMGLVVDLYIPSDLPNSALVAELGLFGNSGLAMTGASNEMELLNCQGCTDDLANNDVKALGYYSTTPYHLMCTSEISSMDELKGKRVRATGPWAGWVNSFGGVPVNITSSEIYEAMERGQLDCSVAPVSWLIAYGLMDVVKTVVETPAGTYPTGMVYDINIPVWESLTDEQRQAMRAPLADAVANLALAYEQEDEEARAKANEEGIQFVTVDGFEEHLNQYREGEVDRVNELAKSRNVEFGDNAKTYVDLIEKWDGIVEETRDDEAAYRAALEENIFSKLSD